ncbi:MAG: diphosphomevalonate decarboxylase [Sphingobacteriia bacterium]|nr:diphosphomevalonate decarboxylase [Sphingobacteriia bacterium]
MIISSGEFGWECPSNIALVKYWGKYAGQIPANPSLSLTLSSCVSRTRIAYRESEQGGMEFLFEGSPKVEFAAKIQRYLDALHADLPWLTRVHLRIESHNTFPHSSGIASSASAMGALALGLASIDRAFRGTEYGDVLNDAAFRAQASDLARRGSGSACRSIYGGYTVWGAHPEVQGSNDRCAVPLDMKAVHPSFHNLQDAVLLVDRGTKSVSSSAGHGLMDGHPYAKARFAQGADRVAQLWNILQDGSEGSWLDFINLVESEALTLHAMMLASTPSYLLMKPSTVAILEEIRRFRNQSGVPVFFTLDAGANVHLLFPESASAQAMELIDKQLTPYLNEGSYLCDGLGLGPKFLTSTSLPV